MSQATAWLPIPLLRRMLAAAERHGDYETGGMLIGYEGLARADEVVVTELIDGGPRARHNEYAFHPDGRWQRKELARVYTESGRVATFLGDWHSHPHGLPLPSDVDVETAARTAANERARAPRPLTVIIGRDEDDWILGAFRFNGDDLTPARIRVFEPEASDLVEALDPWHGRELWPERRRRSSRAQGLPRF